MKNKYGPAAIFNMVIDYIDNSICECASSKIICENMEMETGGVDCHSFNKLLNTLFGIKLKGYISCRRVCLAADFLIKNPSKSISYISDKFGYSEPSAFSRAMQIYYKTTPTDARKNKIEFEDNKLFLTKENEEIFENELDNGHKEEKTLSTRISKRFKERADMFDEVMKNYSDINFDIETCYIMENLAEKLDVPFGMLVKSCSELVTDLFSQEDYTSPKTEKAVELGVTSESELNAIYKYYDSMYYDITEEMVKQYKKAN